MLSVILYHIIPWYIIPYCTMPKQNISDCIISQYNMFNYC